MIYPKGRQSKGTGALKDKHRLLYNSWRAMKGRCNNSNQHDYQYYGAKGIKVCTEWTFFKDFMVWAFDNDYQEGLTIDRIDPKKNYEPSNCRWISHSENVARNNKTRYLKD